MARLKLFYATNRGHVKGENGSRRRPESYGQGFSSDGLENLRFGRLNLSVDADRVRRHLNGNTKIGRGNGGDLAKYLASRAKKPEAISIRTYRENLPDREASDANQPEGAVWGSLEMFAELQEEMRCGADVLVFIHGFNVDWYEAVGSALALQEMLNRKPSLVSRKQIVVLFSWPSDGKAIPHVAYKSDRGDAAASGPAVGRAFLKLRDFLVAERRRLRDEAALPCDGEMNVLCHSMGNFVLQNAVARVAEHTPGSTLPRLFGQVFQCAADVDDEVLEPGRGLGQLHQLANRVNVYFNRGDAALAISDYTKGNTDRLGTAGVASMSRVHNKIHQVDCSPIVRGAVEHSYYVNGRVNDDIRLSLDGVDPDDEGRPRQRPNPGINEFVME